MERAARIKVGVVASVTMLLMLLSLVELPWFVLRLGPVEQSLTLRLISDAPVTGMMFVTLCRVAMYAGVATLGAVLWQSVARCTGNQPSELVGKLGVGAAALCAMGAIGGGYLFGPDEGSGVVQGIAVSLSHTIAPVLLLIGTASAFYALHLTAKEPELSTGLPEARAYSARVPVPEPEAPPSERMKLQSTPIPALVKHKLQFTVLAGELSRAGIDARREDGSTVLVMWRDVVGVVARRLPATLVGATFVDIVSSAGQTLRLLPWSRLTGEELPGGDDGRARALVKLIVGHCPDTKLDPATKSFLDSTNPAAQLPDEATLAAHDARLA